MELKNTSQPPPWVDFVKKWEEKVKHSDLQSKRPFSTREEGWELREIKNNEQLKRH